MNRGKARALLKALAGMEASQRARLIARLPVPAFRAIEEEWWWQAHCGQHEPDGDWRTWLIRAGRGFGKTRAGAEWVWARARENPKARIALVGGTIEDVAKVMIEGESGILAIARSGEEAGWTASRRELVFPSGAVAFAYSGEKPQRLRGPQHHFAWCDELAHWGRAQATWDNLMMGLRLGERPRSVITTTPQPVAVLKRIEALARTFTTQGRTDENPHLPEDFREAMMEMYGGTRVGRQELEGVLFDDVAGSLWPRELIEKCRGNPLPAPSGKAEFARIVVGVDPPASAEGTCGIVVCGLGRDGIGYVLADCSVGGQRPEGWARAVTNAASVWGAARVVAEKNQGGDMVESVLRGADAALPVKLVHASQGKAARAEPVAIRFEAGKAKFAGCFPALEDELAGMTANGGFEGARGSPDRADAMVWAMTELLVSRQRAQPRILVL